LENADITIPENQRYISEENIKEVLSGDGFGIVFAPMGSGKTQALKKYMIAQGNDLLYWKMLMVVVRKSQAMNFKETLRDDNNTLLKFESYLDYIGIENRYKLYTQRKLIITINSLAKILAPGVDYNKLSTISSTIPVYDLLILDEIESILNTLTCCLLNTSKCKQLLVYEIFVSIIKASKRVIFMDGIPTEKKTLSFLRHIGILSSCKSIQYLHYTDIRRYIYYSTLVFEKKFMEDVKNQKRLVLISNIKKTLYLFYDMSLPYEGKQLVICGESDKHERDTIQNPSSEWKQYTRIFFNTVVGAGASYDLPIDNSECYDIMYIVICVCSCDPQELYQLSNRIRHLKEGKVCILLLDTDTETKQNEKKRTLQTPDEFRKIICSDLIKFDRMANFMKFKMVNENLYNKEQTYLDIDTMDYKLVRKLCGEERIRLEYENNYILTCIANDTYWKKYLRISSNYKKELTLLINRNGGLVIDKQNITGEIRKKKSEEARGLLKRARDIQIEMQQERPIKILKETKNQGIDGGVLIAHELKERLCKLVDFSKGELQRNYMQLARCWGEYNDISDLFEHEAFYYFSRKNRLFSNTLVYSTGLLENIEKLFTSLLGLVLVKDTAHLSGIFTTRNLLQHGNDIYNVLINIDSQMKAQSVLELERVENIKEHTAYKQIEVETLKIFYYFGYRIDKEKDIRTRVSYDGLVSNKRINRLVTLYTYKVNELTMDLRMSLAGFDFETHKRTDTPVFNCIQKFVNKYNSKF
jgi:hypothetical protein